MQVSSIDLVSVEDRSPLLHDSDFSGAISALSEVPDLGTFLRANSGRVDEPAIWTEIARRCGGLSDPYMAKLAVNVGEQVVDRNAKNIHLLVEACLEFGDLAKAAQLLGTIPADQVGLRHRLLRLWLDAATADSASVVDGLHSILSSGREWTDELPLVLEVVAWFQPSNATAPCLRLIFEAASQSGEQGSESILVVAAARFTGVRRKSRLAVLVCFRSFFAEGLEWSRHFAFALHETGEFAQAAAMMHKVAGMSGKAADFQQAGMWSLHIGQIEEARRCLREAFRRDPHQLDALYSFLRARPSESDLELLPELLRVLRQRRSMSNHLRADALFCLGELARKNDKTATAHCFFTWANAYKRLSVAYDEASTLDKIRQVRKTPASRFARSRDETVGLRPILIIGMPRSGSSLVEQVLTTCQGVVGAGETGALSRVIRHMGLGRSRYLTRPGSLSPRQRSIFRTAYLGEIASEAVIATAMTTSTTSFTDKQLLNFRYLGLVAEAIPDARFIHTIRDPIETCLSCFSINFNNLPFTYDIRELTSYFLAYRDLMEHWMRILPKEQLHQIRYEEFVETPECKARELVEFCGLSWGRDCLAFHESRRPVLTASSAQVRQPIRRGTPRRSGLPERYVHELRLRLQDAVGNSALV